MNRNRFTLGALLAAGLLLTGLHADTDEIGNDIQTTARTDKKIKYLGWYMRTVVTATLPDGRSYTDATAGVFGELKDSRYYRDRHDIPSMGKGILQVLFVPRWENEGTTYFSDYRRYKRHHKHRERVWTFQVQNQQTVNLADADLKIEVQGPTAAFRGPDGLTEQPAKNKITLRRLKLVDVDNQKVYRAQELKNITLSMDGKHIRTFRWVIGKIRKYDLKPLPESSKTPLFSPALEKTGNPDSFGPPPSL